MHRREMLITLVTTALAACSQGPQGPPGAQGPQGPSGVLPGSFNVLNYGAKPDQASFDNTSSFQSAIDAAANAGGGTVSVPLGRFWFSGNISIGANVTLAGAGVGPYDTGATAATPPTVVAGGRGDVPRSADGSRTTHAITMAEP